MSLADITGVLVTAGVARAYEENKVPKQPAYPYAVVGLSYAAPGVATMDGHRNVPHWLTVKVYARDADGVEAVTALVDGALNGRALPIAGKPVTEFLQANPMSRDADDSGVLGTVLVYRY